MVNHVRITENELDAKVIHIIPRRGVRGQAQVEVRKAGMLGYRCPDYVTERRLKELHGLRRQKIISAGELDDMCFEVVNEGVNAPQNREYAHDFKALMSRHQRYSGALSVGEQVEEICALREKYQQN